MTTLKHARPMLRNAAAAALIALLLSALVFAGTALAATGDDRPSKQAQIAKLSDEVDDLKIEVEGTEHFVEVMLTPIGVLVAILAAGGILGVVYSIRDQRRTSQMHELAVSGEVAAQKRSEQSYGSFLEQSQTTLSLVNDTLQLAKEANDRAMQSTKDKAQSRIDEIEERSQTLLLDVFTEEEFELIITDTHRRNELHDIASELRSLEGFLSLQDITLGQYTKFIKALDQFLLDDTLAAIQALRLSAQEKTVGDLEHFAEYWLGYMLTTIGEYEEALRKFKHDKLALKPGDPEYFQLERIMAETEFFLVAKRNAESETARKDSAVTDPAERFLSVASILDGLSELAVTLDESKNEHGKAHTRLEIARTRADIYEWVAYDANHLDDPLGPDAISAADAVLAGNSKEERPPFKAVEFATEDHFSDQWGALREPDVFRAWALRQAETICWEQEGRDIGLEFALGECLFKLGEDEEADAVFHDAAHTLEHEFKELHEKRLSASLHQSVLICHSRLLRLRKDDPDEVRDQKRGVRDALSDTLDVVKDMRQGRVTVFSQIQRRNIPQAEFKAEVEAIFKQDPMMKKRDQVPA